MADIEKPKELQKAVADKYSVKPGIGIGECKFKGTTIYLDQLTVEEADQLVKDGAKFLIVKKSTPTPTPKP